MHSMLLAEYVQQIAPMKQGSRVERPNLSIAFMAVERYRRIHAHLRQQCACNTITKGQLKSKLQYVQNI